MQSFAVFAAILAVAAAGNLPLAFNHLGYAAAPAAAQYHAQDALGQYSYGYNGGQSAKTETRTADGVTRGGYSYVDANGIVQNVQYVADPVNGFRVSATNLPVGPAPVAAPAVVAAAPAVFAAPAPVAYAAHPFHFGGLPVPPADTPEVAAAKVQHAQAHAEALARSG